MKTFFVLALLALVASSYAAPAPSSDRAIVQALLDNLVEAKLQSLLQAEVQEEDDETVGDMALIEALMQEDEDGDESDDLALIEALVANEEANTQKWHHHFKKAFKKVKNGVKKVAKNPLVRQIGGEVINKAVGVPVVSPHIQEETDDDLALIEALMQEDEDGDESDDLALIEALVANEEAETQKWHHHFKKAFKKVKNGVKKVAKNPLVRQIGGEVINKAVGVPVVSPHIQEETDDDLALIEALMQDNNADAEGWGSFVGGIKNVGKEIGNTVTDLKDPLKNAGHEALRSALSFLVGKKK